ncbi:MAG: response regulator, partial [Candidatus Acidiferrum sp.]
MSLAVQTSAILAARGNLTICVVDADQAQMALTRDCLSRAGFPAIGAVSSHDAFEKARIGRCRVILADCKLPGIDGIAFLEQASRQDSRMHVILMSAAHS